MWISRFDSRAIFLRQCHFQNVLFFLPQAGLKQQEFLHLTASHCVHKSIIALTLKRKTTWMKPTHYYTTLWHYHRDSTTKLRNECLGFIHVVFLFKVRAIMLLWTQLIQWYAVTWKNSRCFNPACGGKSSTFWKWHCFRKTALESKRLIHTWWTWCQITWKRILNFYPIHQKLRIFNQECRWNNGSKSMHSFWATLYIGVTVGWHFNFLHGALITQQSKNFHF